MLLQQDGLELVPCVCLFDLTLTLLRCLLQNAFRPEWSNVGPSGPFNKMFESNETKCVATWTSLARPDCLLSVVLG